MKKVIILLSILLLYFNSNAQQFDQAKMDSLFLLIDTNSKGMGSVSLFVEGEEVYQKTLGYADIEQGIKANENTRYRIGSISKTFTATIIMQLVEENKLALDATLDQFFPDIPGAENITLEHMLRHRSGLFNFTNDPSYTSWMENPKSREELLALFEQKDLDFSPGTKTAYSNTNYVLLSMIAEKVEKSSFPEIIRKRIIQSAGLKNIMYGAKINTANEEALSYKQLDGWQPETETDMSVPLGAGGIISTPTDLNKFMTALFGHQLLSESSLNKMKTKVDGFGMGLFEIPFHDKKAYGHNGGIDGFQSVTAYFPDEKLSVSYLANGVVMPINDIIIGVLSIYFGKPYELPTFTSITLTAEELDPYLGVYSNPSFPLKVTISKDSTTLIGQATGQPSFPLDAYEKDKFKFDQAMLKLEFIPAENKMILRQGGGEFVLTKE